MLIVFRSNCGRRIISLLEREESAVKNNNHFKKNILARAIASCTLLGGCEIAIAQQVSSEAIEEVEVVGIRASLKRAMDTKRDANGVVDAITAEDIGKFPDTNLAESLQRITGVSIDRARGEGSQVTVRGFGPHFNLVTLNGRQMPNSNTDASDFSRSFDFSDLASEGVAAVEIYKSGKASVPTGGIGSTINIKTTKPLEAPGLKASVGIKGVYDTSTNGSTDLTPEVSGIYSQTFADDTIGIAITASRQERDSGENTARVGGWRSFNGTAASEEWGGIPVNDAQENRPGEGDIYGVPQSVGYELTEYNRVRTNGQLTLQWDATENVRATLDYTFSEHEVERTYSNYSAWYNFGGQESLWTDGPNASPLVYAENTQANPADFAMGTGADATITENSSIGFNIEWDVNENLRLAFDYHDSNSESKAAGPFGSSSLLSIASFTRAKTTTYFGGELPILNVELSKPLSADDMIVTGSVFANDASEMNVEQSKLSGTFEFDDAGMFESIDFGVQISEVENQSLGSVVQRDAWGGVTQAGAISDLLTPASSSGAFDQFSSSSDSRFTTDYFTFSLAELVNRTEMLMASGEATTFNANDMGDCGTGLCASSNFSSDRRTVEKTNAAYVQLNLAADWNDMPVVINLGLRYEQTDVNSKALSPFYNQLNWTGGNEFSAVSDGQDFTQRSGDYSALLPNLDFNISLTDDLVARASISKTLTRPTFRDIQGGQTIDQLVRVNGGTGSRGNPDLLPFESLNYDLSVEWYYGESSYASIGYYKKSVDNFISSSEVNEAIFNLPHPVNGPLYQQAVDATGSSDSGVIRQYILDNFADQTGVDAENGVISGVAGRDGPANFLVQIPINLDNHVIKGWEFAVQHSFGESGFGVIANATIVDGDAEFNNLELGEQTGVLEGLSDSANLIGFYDKNGLQVRVAYNWRDDFLAGKGQDNVGAAPPTNVSDYGQWDINASYTLNDNLTFFVEAINVTDETNHIYGRSSSQTLFARQSGPRYNIGARYTF